MSDSEKNLLNSKVSDDIIVEEVVAKAAKPAKAAKKSKKKDGFFSQVKAEFKKIIWPSRQSLFRQTVAVIASSVIVGVIIVIVDNVIRIGLNLIIQ